MIELKFDDKGLIPVIAQDANTLQVLMLAYAKKEQVEKTLATGIATYFSRSRNKEWIKGESSGNIQKVLGILVDCDQDTLIYLVDPKGPACHTGQVSCFFRKFNESGELEKNE